MDLLAKFNDKSEAGLNYQQGMFAHFIEALTPFSEDYEQAVEAWNAQYENNEWGR